MSLKELLTRIINALKVDYIIEEGTSGIWTYRKWNNGIAECWGRYSTTLTNYATSGSYYGYYTSVNLPNGLFITTQIPVHTYVVSIGNGFSMPASGMGSDYQRITVYALANVSGSQTCYFDINVKGRWK